MTIVPVRRITTAIRISSGSRIIFAFVQILGFGTFEVKERAARTGRNPHTGETMEIPAAKVVCFKAGKALRERINN